MENQITDREISHIKEEENEENSSSDVESDANITKENISSQIAEVTSKAAILKRQESFPYPTKTKRDLDDGLSTKFDYSRVNTKRDTKKLDEVLTAKYDYSRVAQKRPTMLEKQYNFSNNNLLNRKETQKKTIAEPKRDDTRTNTMARRSVLKPGGTIISQDKPLIFTNKPSLGNITNNSAENKSENTSASTNKTQDLEPFDLNIKSPIGESQVKRRTDKRVSMVVNPVKRDSIMINNNNNTNKNLNRKPDASNTKEKENGNYIKIKRNMK